MESQLHESADAERSSPAVEAPRVRRRVVAALIFVFVLAAGGALFAQWTLSRWKPDYSPPARDWVNAPYITTPMDVVDKMCELAEVKEGELLYDLGCGDGRIAIVAAEKYGSRSVGFDIDSARIRDSLQNAKTRGVEDRTAFEERDVFTLDLSEADVVAMYLLPRYMQRLMPQFAQMRPGARIVTHDFPIEGVPPDKTVRMISAEDGQEHAIHLWITPLKAPEKKP